MIASIEEILKGVTNLPIALGAVWLVVLSVKDRLCKEVTVLFSLLAVSATLGFVVHFFAWDDWGRRILWGVLYPFLYETVRRLIFLLSESVSQKKPSEKKKTAVFGLEVLFCLISVVLAFCDNDLDVVFLGGFCLGLFVLLLVLAWEHKERAKELRTLCAVLGVALLFELLKDLLPIPIGVVVCHIAVCVSLFFLYRIAKRQGKESS